MPRQKKTARAGPGRPFRMFRGTQFSGMASCQPPIGPVPTGSRERLAVPGQLAPETVEPAHPASVNSSPEPEPPEVAGDAGDDGVRDIRITDFYTPFPRQKEFHESPAKYRLFGGAAGPGKTKAL